MINIILMITGFSFVFSMLTFWIVKRNLRRMRSLYGKDGVTLGLKNLKKSWRGVFLIMGIGGFLILAYVAYSNGNFITNTQNEQDTLIMLLCSMLMFMFTSGLVHGAAWTVWQVWDEAETNYLQVNVDRIEKIVFFKKDKLMTERVYCEFIMRGKDGQQTWFSHEDKPEWKILVSQFEKLSGFDLNWGKKVILSPSQESRTIAFQRL